MTKHSAEDFETVIREEKDPAALQAKLVAMIEAAHPVNPFRDGETMPFFEFERRFKKFFCDDVEPRYQQRQVKVLIDQKEGLMLSLQPKEVQPKRLADPPQAEADQPQAETPLLVFEANDGKTL